ncbi:MAG: leucyl aminopeptidase, partial [Pseudonocardia sp.]|nr:leucyl aminopeptidase [Pseudonocardia sp.]
MSPEISSVAGSPAAIDADAVVIGLVGEDGDGPPRLAPGAEDLDTAFDGQLAGLLAVAGATGKSDDVVKLPTRGVLTAPLLVAVGLGKAADGVRPEQVRRASGAAARSLAGTEHAVSTLGRIDLAAAAEGSLLGAYTFTSYRTNGNRKAPLARLSLVTDASDAADVLRTAAAVGEAVRTARDLVNTPPNDLYPETFAARAREL